MISCIPKTTITIIVEIMASRALGEARAKLPERKCRKCRHTYRPVNTKVKYVKEEDQQNYYLPDTQEKD